MRHVILLVGVGVVVASRGSQTIRVCLTIGDSGGVVIPVAGPPVEVNEEPARGVERWKWETSVSDEVSGWVEKEAQEGSRREGCAEEEGAMAMVDEVGDSGSGGGA